jgi:hypothetical protein
MTALQSESATHTHLLPELCTAPEALDDDVEEAVVLASLVAQPRQGHIPSSWRCLLLLLWLLVLRMALFDSEMREARGICPCCLS